LSMTHATAGDVTSATGGPTATRRSARREATRTRLMQASVDVFAERGFHGASVEDICERAGFTRGAFYSNFSSKDDLVLALYDQHIDRLSARVESLAARETADPGFLLQTEFTLHAIRDKQAGRAWARQQAKVRARLTDLVERIAERHGVRLSVTPEEFVRLGLAIYQGGMAQHLLEPRAVRRGALERRFLPLVLQAVTEDG
jgi:AcrR family transcriptional regulator